VKALRDGLSVPIGFHAHNNLGMAIANSVAAAEAGASILDGTARGFGAGAGNAQLEVLVAVLHRLGWETGIDLYKLLDAADLAETQLMMVVPTISSTSMVWGLAGVFWGFAKPVGRGRNGTASIRATCSSTGRRRRRRTGRYDHRVAAELIRKTKGRPHERPRSRWSGRLPCDAPGRQTALAAQEPAPPRHRRTGFLGTGLPSWWRV
jgi:hypothetical protein